MSHFTVLVIGDDVEDQLAPFQENNMGDCPEEYMEFADKEDEFREEWKDNTLTVRDWYPEYRMEVAQEIYDELKEKGIVLIPNYKNELLSTIKKGQKNTIQFRYKETTDGKRHSEPIDVEVEKVVLVETADNPSNNTYAITLKKIQHKDVSIQDKYKSFEKYVNDYHGFQEPDENTGRYGYWQNLNSKWDWYVIGGRWRGSFKLKPGCQGELGSPGAFNNDPQHEGWVDQACKGDIDWDTMKEAQKKNLEETWEKAQSHDARDRYIRYNIDEDITTKEQYISNNLGFSTFAVLKDGEWFERGEMGWWGIATNEKENDKWQRELNKLLEEIDDDTLLTVVDCHI